MGTSKLLSFRDARGHRVTRATAAVTALLLLSGLVALGVRSGDGSRRLGLKSGGDEHGQPESMEPGVVDGVEFGTTTATAPPGRDGSSTGDVPRSTTTKQASGATSTSTTTNHEESPPPPPPDPRVKLFPVPRVPYGNFPAEATNLAWVGGYLWFTTGHGYLGRITPDGTIALVATGDSLPEHLAAGPDGNVWFTDDVGNPEGYRVGYVTPAGNVRYFVVGGVAPSDLTDIAAGPDGAMWFTMVHDVPGGTIGVLGRVTMDGAVTLRTLGDGLTGLTLGPDGFLWVLDGHTVRRVRSDGNVTDFPIPDGWIVKGKPVIGPDRNIWMLAGKAGTAENSLLRLTPGGEFSSMPLPSKFLSLYRLVVGPDGNLWVADWTSPWLLRITLGGKVLEEIAVGGWPRDMASGPDGNLWFTTGGSDGFMSFKYAIGYVRP